MKAFSPRLVLIYVLSATVLAGGAWAFMSNSKHERLSPDDAAISDAVRAADSAAKNGPDRSVDAEAVATGEDAARAARMASQSDPSGSKDAIEVQPVSR